MRCTGGLPDYSIYKSLAYIVAYDNKLDGNLPAKLPPALEVLLAQGNKLKGESGCKPAGTWCNLQPSH
jgi:hypothetical protein